MASSDSHAEEKNVLDRHRVNLSKQTSTFVLRFATGVPGAGQNQISAVGPGAPQSISNDKQVTAEQKVRGKRGEEEIKRRLQLPNGLTLVSDVRELGCGYDFLCALGGREVKVEVKTFTYDGRVFVTPKELQAAATSRGDYYLVGVLDDGQPEWLWSTFVLPNPIEVLLTKGEFDIDPTLHVLASALFTLPQTS
jgi:hypothetical protein